MLTSLLKSAVLYSALLLGMTACFAHKKKIKTAVVSYTSQNATDEKIATVIEELPQYPGGSGAMHDFIHKTKNFPQDAVNDGVEGRVVVSIIVRRDGSLTDVKVAKSIHQSLDKEAVRVVKAMPKWIPAKRMGKVVDVQMFIPVNFYFLR